MSDARPAPAHLPTTAHAAPGAPSAAHIVAPHGSPLAFAVVSCRSLADSLSFYVDRIGFDAGPVVDCTDGAFAHGWGLERGTGALACLLTASGSSVGRILLVEFAAPQRQTIALESSARQFGLANLNFYTADIQAAAAGLRTAGFRFWTEPTEHGLTAGVGSPIEVLFDGPDGVAINLIELATRDPSTRIGQMRAFVERHGYTRAGFTPVVTTAHVARSIARAREFYEQVLGMRALIDEELALERSNAFLRLPRDARTHITFMQGNHMFGKIALSEPLNYDCLDLVPRAMAPHIGYLAQGFEVADPDAAEGVARSLGAAIVTGGRETDVPGLGRRRGFLARNPGSGALQWIVSAS